jgi:hypothetical protein
MLMRIRAALPLRCPRIARRPGSTRITFLPAGFIYAVTNAHVIESGACCIRLNTQMAS